MSGVVKSTVKIVKRTVAGVGNVINSAVKGVGKVLSTVGKAIEGTVKQALKDPIGTIAQIAAVASGQLWLLPVISAGQTIAAGGSLEDALKSAAISYAAGKIGSFAGDYAGGMFENAVPNAAGKLTFQTTSARLAQSLAQGAITGATQAGLSGRDVMEGLKSGLISGGTGFVASQYVTPYLSKNLAEIANITGDTNKFITGMTSAATKGALAAGLQGRDAAAGAMSAMTGYGMKFGVDYAADAAGNMYDAFGRQFNASNADSVLKLTDQNHINDYGATLAAKGLEENKHYIIDDEGRVWSAKPVYSKYTGAILGYEQGKDQFNPALLGKDVEFEKNVEDSRWSGKKHLAPLDYDGKPYLPSDFNRISGSDADNFKRLMSLGIYNPAYNPWTNTGERVLPGSEFVYGDDYTITTTGVVIDKYGNVLPSNAYDAQRQLLANQTAMGDDPGLLYTEQERSALHNQAQEAVRDYTEAAQEYEDLQRTTLEKYNQRLEEWNELGTPGTFEDFYHIGKERHLNKLEELELERQRVEQQRQDELAALELERQQELDAQRRLALEQEIDNLQSQRDLELAEIQELQDFYEGEIEKTPSREDQIQEYLDDIENWKDNSKSLSLSEYRDAKEVFSDPDAFDDLLDTYTKISPDESLDDFLGRYDDYKEEQSPEEFEEWLDEQYWQENPEGFDNIEDYNAWKETDLPAEEFREMNDEFKQYISTVDPFAPPKTGFATIKYNPATGQYEQEKLPTTPEELREYRDNKIAGAYEQESRNELYRDDLDEWRSQGSPGEFGLWRIDKYDGYAPTGDVLLQQRYEASGTNLSYEDWLDESKQEFADNYIAQEKELARQLQQNRINYEEYNNLVESGDMPTGITFSDYDLGKEEWKSSGSDLPVGEWIADKQEWEASGSELPLDEWQAEKYYVPEPEPEPEPEDPFTVEIPETELAAPEGGEIDFRTGITWNQNEDGEWIGFDADGNVYGEGGEQIYSAPEDVEGEVDALTGITWYPSEDGSKIGVDEDGNYYNEDGSIFWQPDYSAEFEMGDGFTPDTEGYTEFDPDEFAPEFVPEVEPGQTPTDIFDTIKDVLGGAFGQGLHRELQRRLSQPQQEQIYGSGRSYPRTPTGIYQRSAQPTLGSGFDWSSIKAGEQPKFSETRDDAFQAEKPEVGAPELFDPLKDTKWAPMSRIEGLGFAGKFINQEPISMSTFDQKSKPIQTQQVEQDTPMTTGWKTADELQAEKEQDQYGQQFQPEEQDMFFDPTDVNLAQPWWQQPEFQQQQNTMPVYAAQGGLIDHNPQFYSEGGASVGMRHVKGDGDGTSDSVPAMLAADEYVLPADIVSSLGNGSSDAGANVLDQFVQIIREHKRNADPEDLPEDSQGPLSYLAEAYERAGA
jgi:hypothetical protein